MVEAARSRASFQGQVSDLDFPIVLFGIFDEAETLLEDSDQTAPTKQRTAGLSYWKKKEVTQYVKTRPELLEEKRSNSIRQKRA